VKPAHPDDAHRKLERQHELAAILCHVESRTVNNGYTIEYEAQRYRIEPADVRTGLRNAVVRVEQRRDGTIAVRFRDQYLRCQECERPEPAGQARPSPSRARTRKGPNAGGKSSWMDGFMDQSGPSLKQAIAMANATS
jgi:hypothetical protein